MELNAITGQVVDSALKVHSILGPGLLERAYAECLAHELRLRGFSVEREVPLLLVYEGVEIGICYRLDLVVEGRVVVEVKGVATLVPVYRAQLLSHVRIGKYPVGLLMNFHSERLRDGIKRVINSMRGAAGAPHQSSGA